MHEKTPGKLRGKPSENSPQTSNIDTISAIHSFWFGQLNAAGLADSDRHSLWFSASRETDAECRERFGAALENARAGRLTDWANSHRGLVALVILLDQFSRNIHRNTPLAFASDSQALALARGCIDSGRHKRLPAIHRVFMYLPLEHSEDLQTQRDSVALFSALAADEPGTTGFLSYARAHHDVIERFGRFPHRNAILGRKSSAQELDYLAKHGGF